MQVVRVFQPTKHSQCNRFFSIITQTHDPSTTSSSSSSCITEEVDIPKPKRCKSERKPYPTPMKQLIQRAKLERQARNAQPCRMLEHAPDNGLLVPQLVDIAHSLYSARQSLLEGISRLIKLIPVLRCRFCFEVHIGYVGHNIRTCKGPDSGSRGATHVWRRGGVGDVVFIPKCFHLYDRVGKPRVVHGERFIVSRLPAIVELCIQAGVDLEEYPTKRRTRPVYSIEGRIVDFESVAEDQDTVRYVHSLNLSRSFHSKLVASDGEFMRNNGLKNLSASLDQLSDDDRYNLKLLSTKTLDSWFQMISGTKKIMEKYSVWTCGYCPEIQVGPKGHKVRMCKASKHQSRDGMHAWQEATIEDLVGPNYVWHVRDLHGPPLENNLKRFYGKAPALVELCVQAGAPVPDDYRSMMRLDVVSPDRDEVDLVA